MLGDSWGLNLDAETEEFEEWIEDRRSQERDDDDRSFDYPARRDADTISGTDADIDHLFDSLTDRD